MRVWLVLGALALAAAAAGLTLGLRTARLDEGEAILRVANAHAAATGRPATDCAGRPGLGRVWIEVACGGTVYHVARTGRILTRTARPGGAL